MAMDHARVAKDVLTYVGGADNINAAAHCATRLRLVLNDMDKVDQKALDKDPDLKGTFIAGGMFQIIVGPGDVDLVFSEMIRTGGVKEVSKDEAKEQAAKSGNPLSRFIKAIADIFVPLLPALVAGGLMMAIHNVLTADFFTASSFVTSDNPTGAYGLVDRFSWLADYDDVINLVSSAAFAFLPVLVGFSAVKRFGGNVYLGAAMGAAMVSTQLTSAYEIETARQAGTIEVWHLFGLTVDKIGYQAMVIPVLCVSWLLAYIEKWLHKRLSGTADFLLTPLITLLVTGFLTFVVVGPLARELSDGITNGLSWLYTTAGPLGGFLFGMVYSPIVVTGLHQSFPAVELPLIADKASTGGSFIFPIASMANVAQGAVALAVFLKTRDAKMKGLAGAGGVSALFGITEPAIFGVNLRLRWPFFIGMGAAGIGGILVSLLDLRTHSLGAAGMVGFVSMRTTDIPKYLAVEVFTIIIAFAAAYAYASTRGRASLAGDDVDADEAALEAEAMAEHAETVELPAEATEDFTVTAPIQGRAIPLSEVEDQTFASGMLGPGMAIAPAEGPVVSPVDGEVLVAFPTGHAYGLRSASGVELLIHVGMDTVQLEGKHFSPKVKAGDKVLRGMPLVDVDWAAVGAAGYQTVTPIVVSNAQGYEGIEEHGAGTIHRGDALFDVVRKADDSGADKTDVQADAAQAKA